MKITFKNILLNNTLFILFFSLISVATVNADSKVEKPNFVVIVADDVSWDSFGCTGSKHALTPNIDKLSTQALHFNRMYTAVSQCTPARAELYSGLYPHNNGVLGNKAKKKVPKVKSVTDHLVPLGYKVGITGKGHSLKKSENLEIIKGFPQGCNSSIGEYSLDGVSSFIKTAQKENTPFCVFICSIHAHHPWDLGNKKHFQKDKLKLPDHYIDTPLTREALIRHAAEVEELDNQVGDTMKMLKQMKLEENTVLIFLSEQGTAMPRGKWTIYDYGNRALGLVRWTGKITPERTDNVAQYCDFLPTFVELAGGKAEGFDGKSMKDLWFGKTKVHREFAFLSNTSPVWQRSIVTKEYKLIWNPVRNGKYIWNNYSNDDKFFSGPWKEWLIKAKNDSAAKKKIDLCIRPDELELYRIDKDPYEMNNLASSPKYSERTQQMLAQLKNYMKKTGDSK